MKSRRKSVKFFQKFKQYLFTDPVFSSVQLLPGIKRVMHNPFRLKSLLEFLEQSCEGTKASRIQQISSNICRTLEKDMSDWGKENSKFYNRLLNSAEYLVRRIRLSSFPTRIYLELTNACNLNCPMCGQSFFKGKRKYLDLKALDKLVPLYPYLDDLCLAGFGETLLYPDIEKVFEAIPSFVPTRIITNGLLLTEKMMELLAGRLDSLWLSFEATDPKTYQYVRGIDGYDTVVEQLRKLQEIKKKTNTHLPRLYLCFVSMRSNIEQLPAYIEQAATLGATGVNVNFLTVFQEKMIEESLYCDREKAEKYFEEARKKASELNLELILPGQDTPDQGNAFNCAEPWKFSYISANGDIIPCCVNNLPLGNIYEQEFADIWNNDRYANFRKRVNSTKDRPERCRRCIIDAHRSVWDKNRHFQLINEKNQLVKDKEID